MRPSTAMTLEEALPAARPFLERQLQFINCQFLATGDRVRDLTASLDEAKKLQADEVRQLNFIEALLREADAITATRAEDRPALDPQTIETIKRGFASPDGGKAIAVLLETLLQEAERSPDSRMRRVAREISKAIAEGFRSRMQQTVSFLLWSGR